MLNYHRVVQNAILDFGTSHMHKEITSVSKGGELLYIHHRSDPKLKPMTVKPDGIFIMNNQFKSKIVFQVLDSQRKHNREIEADIFRAYLCSGVGRLVFVVPTKQDLENVSRLSSIIQDNLEGYGNKFYINFALTLLIPKIVGDRKMNRKMALRYLAAPNTSREIFK